MKKIWKKVLAGMLAVVMVLTSFVFDWSNAAKAEAAEASENMVAGDVLADVDFTKTDLSALDEQFVASQGTSDSDRKEAANVSEYWTNGEKGTVNAATGGTATMDTMSGHTAGQLIDGKTDIVSGPYRDSADVTAEPETATITFAGNAYYEINELYIQWRDKNMLGCPEAFKIEAFNGSEWVTVIEETEYKLTDTAKATWQIAPIKCNAIRLVVTKLRQDDKGKYCLQLREIEARGEKVEYLKTTTTYNSETPIETLLTWKNPTVKNFKAEIEMVYFNSSVTRYGLYFGQSEAIKVAGANLIQPFLGSLTAYGGLYANGVQANTTKYVNENDAIALLENTNSSNGINLFNLGTSYVYNKFSIKDFPKNFNEGNLQTLNVEVINDNLTLWWTGFEKAAWTVKLTDYTGGYISIMSRGNDQGGIKRFKVQEYVERQKNDIDFAGADLTALDEQFIASQGTNDADRVTATNVSEYWTNGEKETVNAATGGTATMNTLSGFTAGQLIDGKTDIVSGPYRDSADVTAEPETATITFAGNAYYEISELYIQWRDKSMLGCPEAFKIEAFNGSEWVTVIEETEYKLTDTAKATWQIEPIKCNAIRLVVTKLRQDDKGKYCLQLREIEARGEKVEYLKTKTAYNKQNPTTTLLTLKGVQVENFKAEIEMVYFDSTKTGYGLYFGQSEPGVTANAKRVMPIFWANTTYGGLRADGVDQSSPQYLEADIANYLTGDLKDGMFNPTGGGTSVYTKGSINGFPTAFSEENIQTLNVQVIDDVLKLWWTGYEKAAWTVLLNDYEGGYISLYSQGADQGGIKSFRFHEVVDSELQSNVDMNVETLGDYTIVSVTNDIAGGILKNSTFNGNLKYDTAKFEYCTTVITDSKADVHENVVATETNGSVNVNFSSYNAVAVAKLYFKNTANELDYRGFGVKVDSITRANGKSAKSTTTETVAYDYTGAEGKPDKFVDARDLVRAAKENKAPAEMRSALVGVGSDWVAGIIGEVKDTVYVDAVKGSYTGKGTAESPLNSMSLAAYQVADKGTIQVVGDYKFGSEETTIGMGQKTITITGSNTTLDLTGISTLELNGAVTLDNVQMNVGDKILTVFANGHNLTVNSGVEFEGAIAELYGGNRGEIPLTSTNINLQAGNYYIIYGGSRSVSTITGDTNVVLGGTVNKNHPDFKLTDHKYNEIVCVYAGSRNGLVKGNTNVTMEGNATTSYVHGGGWGQSSEVSGTCNVYVKGGNVSGYYGGSLGGTVYKTNIVMTDGETEQIFGGSWVGSYSGWKANITGSTNVAFTGGKVTRRIFGGCYNDKSTDGNLVNGTSTLNIGGSANYDHSYGALYDLVICAGSRFSTNSDAETSVLNITTDRNNAFGTYIDRIYGSSDTVNIVTELP